MAVHRNRQSVSRTYDYLYDPVYTVCSAKNYPKTAASRLRPNCLFRSCENFPPVFDDHSKHPGANSGTPKRIDVDGKERHLFFRGPVMPFLKPDAPAMRFRSNLECDNLEKSAMNGEASCSPLLGKTETKETQTDYRESEAQTLPWTPSYRVRPDESPEVLAIAHLTWGQGLPAGMHEVEIINRMRMKRAWEAILPPMDSEANVKTRTMIIEAMEIDDWAFREAEIQFIMDMRMELMEKYTKAKEEARERVARDRYRRLESSLDDRRDKEVMSIRQRLGRELRKLVVKHRGGQSKWEKKCNAARGLHVHGIQGLNKSGKSYHEIINKRILRDKNIPETDEEDRYILIPTYSQLKTVKPRQKVSELCARETRWSDEKLRQLHAELKSIRMDLKPDKKTKLIKRKYKLPAMPVTPVLYGAQNANEKRDQAATFIQKLVTGRAIQCVMFEGRDRCRELIEEVQSTHWLELETKKLRQAEKQQVIGLQREQNRRMVQEDRLNEILNMLEGMTLSGMLDYLSKELVRLKDERKAHAFALLAERERTKREAEEAGRRQLEEQRRREHDEMFRQIVKVNQDTVELYLEDIIKEGIEWTSDTEARKQIAETTDKMDKALIYADENAEELAGEELVSDMIYNFVLQDVEKQIVRDKMRKRQTGYLRNAHAAIYNKILELPAIERNLPDQESLHAEENPGEEAQAPDQAVEERERETSEDWIKRKIIDEIISPGKTLAENIMENLIRRTVLSDSEIISRDIVEGIIGDVEALGNSKLSISAGSSSSVSLGSFHSSESSSKSSIVSLNDEDNENQ